MRRLTVEEILIPGAKVRTDEIDFDKEPELKALFEQTRKNQEELLKLKEVQPDWNLLINI